MENLYEIKSSQGPGKFVISTVDGFSVQVVLPPNPSAEKVTELEAGAIAAVRSHNAAVFQQLADMGFSAQGKPLKELRHLLWINSFPHYSGGSFL